MQSDTKSVLSLVTGLAVERRRLRLDDTALSFFPANWARPVDFLFTHIIGASTR